MLFRRRSKRDTSNQTKQVQSDRNHEIVLQAIKDRIDVQRSQIENLDSKANFCLGSASLITASLTAIGLGRSDFEEQSNSIPIYPFEATGEQLLGALAVFAIFAYLFIVFSAYKAYQIRVYEIAPNPQPFLDKYWRESPQRTTANLSASLADTFRNNSYLAQSKAKWVRRAVKGLAAQSVVLLAIAIANFWLE